MSTESPSPPETSSPTQQSTAVTDLLRDFETSGTFPVLFDAGRLVHKSSSSFKMDVLEYALSSSTRSREHTELCAYLAFWMHSSELLKDVEARAELGKRVEEKTLIKGLLNTAVDTLQSWLLGSARSVRAKSLTFAVQIVYHLMLRESVEGFGGLRGLLGEDGVLKELMGNLLLLFVSTCPKESRVPEAPSMDWLYDNGFEKRLLQNAVGACLEEWLCVFDVGNESAALDALLTSPYFANALQLIMDYHNDPLQAEEFATFAPSLPLPDLKAVDALPNPLPPPKRAISYPWAPSLVCMLAVSEKARIAIHAHPGCGIFIQEFDYLARVAIARRKEIKFEMKLNGNRKHFVEQDRIPAAAAAGSYKKRSPIYYVAHDSKRLRDTVEPTAAAARPRENGAPAPLAGKVNKLHSVGVSPGQSSHFPGSRGESLTPQQWNHVSAAQALTRLAWRNGVPWDRRFSTAKRPDELTRTESFCDNCPPLDESNTTLIDLLLNVSKIVPTQAATTSISSTSSIAKAPPNVELLYMVPNPASLSFAAATSARASLLAQLKRYKSDKKANVAEITRSVAYTMLAATRVQARQVKQSEVHDDPFHVNNPVNQIYPAAEISSKHGDVIKYCKRSGFANAAWAHVAMARTIDMHQKFHERTSRMDALNAMPDTTEALSETDDDGGEVVLRTMPTRSCQSPEEEKDAAAIETE